MRSLSTYHSSLALFGLIAVFLLSQETRAEFIRTGTLNYFAVVPGETGSAGLTVVPPTLSASGVMIFSSSDSIPVQEFNPNKLTSSNSRSLFVSYSARNNTFDRLILPGGSSFEINGALSVNLDFIRVSMNTSATGTPYLTVVDQRGDSPSIVGIVGTQVMYTASGQKAIAYLEADQLARRFQGAIDEFTISKDGKLLLRDKPFTEPKVGLKIEADNPCMSQGTVVTDLQSFTDATSGKVSPDLQKLLKDTVNGEDPDNPWHSYLPLNISKDSIVAVHFSSGDFFMIQEEKTRLSGVRICTATQLMVK